MSAAGVGAVQGAGTADESIGHAAANEPGGAAGDSARDVGVGPWLTERGEPLPSDPRFDPELLAVGDRRNVADEFRYWRLEAVVEELDERAAARVERTGRELQVAIESWTHDLNIGSVVRTANALGVRHVHIVGRRRWNRRGAMVTDRYLHVHYHPQVADLVAAAQAQGLTLVGIDNVVEEADPADPTVTLPASRALEGVVLPARCVLVFGAEGPGLSPEARRAAGRSGGLFHITQDGSTRSLNAAAAAAIAMYHWRVGEA